MIIFTLTSCMDNTSGMRFENDYIVVAGSIYAGEYVVLERPIIIGKTQNLTNVNRFDLIEKYAEVTLEELETNEQVKLEFLGMGYIDKNQKLIIKEGKTYRLTVKVDEDEVWAETTVPFDFELIDIQDSYTFDSNKNNFPNIPHSEIDMKHPLKIKVPFRNETRIRVEYYCLEEFENAFFVSPFSDYLGAQPNDRAEYEGNDYDPGWRKNIELSSLYPNEDNIMNLPFHQFQFWFYGNHKITIEIVDENYFRYNYKSQGYFYGGVSKGGIGYFGSAVSKAVYTKVIK